MGATKPVTDQTFEAEVLQSTRTVLVDYWAERCGLSKMIAPILEAIAEEHGDKLGIVKLNVDENPQVTQKYNILNIPTWRRIRRFRLTGALDGPEPGAPEHGSSLSVHELAGPEVLQDPGYRAAVSTPWRDRVVASALRRERRVFGLRNAIGA
jgi:thioredoxin 1